ncbi:MAG: hypothetical protein CME65_14460 [Halobacteriovoraceae bacterium]|nr:hypothetical protein [Halobacteriovoraceae bacterium]|tara:strand:+ start:28334 stop:29749 length:1416 start_codon:yes stop_codon:yes gene_type:complete
MKAQVIMATLISICSSSVWAYFPSDSKPIIIAIVDTGVDINHPSLNSHIWTNQAEIPNNGLDDDYNGYVDDIAGWNFIGAREGSAHFILDNEKPLIAEQKLSKQIYADTSEIVREYNSLFRLTTNSHGEANARLEQLQFQISSKLARAHRLLSDYEFNRKVFETSCDILGIDPYELTDQNSLGEKPERGETAKTSAYNFLRQILASGIDYHFIQDEIKLFQTQIDFHYNINLDQRSGIVRDNPSLFIEKGYGNNDVKGPNPKHGSMVSLQVINSLNLSQGKILFMPLRAIPNGAERDKDVANAIYYAVDNGAQIINLSFGKYFSEWHGEVWSAMQYAERMGVVIVMAAGNDQLNLDEKPSYPNKTYLGVTLQNTLIIGASNSDNERASFSNFGESSVDLFARGERIYLEDFSPEPVSGSSFAAPIVTSALAELMLLTGKNPFEILSVLKDSASYSTQNIPILNFNQALDSL